VQRKNDNSHTLKWKSFKRKLVTVMMSDDQFSDIALQISNGSSNLGVGSPNRGAGSQHGGAGSGIGG